MRKFFHREKKTRPRLQLTVKEKLGRYRKILAIMCAAATSLLLLYAGHEEPEAQKSVVVASRALPLGTQLQASDLAVKQFPVSVVDQLQGVFAEPEEVIGKQLAVPIVSGSPLVRHQFLGTDLLAGLEEGFQAVTVRPADKTTSQVISPGSSVDVLVPAASSEGRPEAVTAVRQVRVLFNSAFDHGQSSSEKGLFGAAEQHSPVLVIAVADDKVPEVAAAAAQGGVLLTLNPAEPVGAGASSSVADVDP